MDNFIFSFESHISLDFDADDEKLRHCNVQGAPVYPPREGDKYRRLYLKESREAALCFIECCKYGGVPIARDVARKIARMIYGMYIEWRDE